MEDAMIAAALAARRNAHAPYSGFHVGAAARCERGLVHAGCNVENAAYPEGTCAEAGAIAALVMAGSRRITAVVVAGPGPGPCTPCGGCRQKIREFAGPDTEIRMVGPDGRLLLASSLDALLPCSFGPHSLG